MCQSNVRNRRFLHSVSAKSPPPLESPRGHRPLRPASPSIIVGGACQFGKAWPEELQAYDSEAIEKRTEQFRQPPTELIAAPRR
jgi:hypothetical protein